MLLVKVAAAVLNQTPLDWDGNRSRIVGALREAARRQVDFLCLPELCISGYGCEDAFNSRGLHRTALEVLGEIVPETVGVVAAIGLPVLYDGRLFNAVAVVADGRIRGFVAKQNLAGEGLHYEPRWFDAWPAGAVVDIEVIGVSYPLGDLVFDVGGVRVGFEICEDAWVPERPGASLAARGVDLILNPSASHFAFGKYPFRRRCVAEGSRLFDVTYVYANLVGDESGRAIYDGGALIATGGEIVESGQRFGFAPFGLTSRVVDVERTRGIRSSTESSSPRLRVEGRIVEVAHGFAAHDLETRPEQPAAWELGGEVREEEFSRSVALALFDYLRKSRARGYVLSLSGGADSAAVACLVALMVRLGCEELGVDGFKHRLSYLPLASDDVRGLVGELLWCAYQSTRNSSEVTRDAARTLAEAVGARFFELDVEPLVQGYVSMVEGALGRALTWEDDDITLQNIQARVRSPGIWMLANVRGAILLATSNRSEASTGYATMDGDTSGGLAPIAGINKAWLRRWLAWLEETGPGQSAGVAALSRINVQQPTAELRPPGARQTDEDDLMPYPILDAIEQAAIRDKQTPLEALSSVAARFPEVPPERLREWVERFYTLWCRSQWKRERLAPALHVDDENVDPKTWCRFPILSGGYTRELRELREVVGDEEPR